MHFYKCASLTMDCVLRDRFLQLLFSWNRCFGAQTCVGLNLIKNHCLAYIYENAYFWSSRTHCYLKNKSAEEQFKCCYQLIEIVHLSSIKFQLIDLQAVPLTFLPLFWNYSTEELKEMFLTKPHLTVFLLILKQLKGDQVSLHRTILCLLFWMTWWVCESKLFRLGKCWIFLF